jgi:hypothetical protein
MQFLASNALLIVSRNPLACRSVARFAADAVADDWLGGSLALPKAQRIVALRALAGNERIDATVSSMAGPLEHFLKPRLHESQFGAGMRIVRLPQVIRLPERAGRGYLRLDLSVAAHGRARLSTEQILRSRRVVGPGITGR